MISSTMPSAKYSCSGSPLILAKGSTAIDGLSGSGSGVGRPCLGLFGPAGAGSAVDPHRPRDVLDLLLAQILEGEIELVAHLVPNTRLTQIPPGSASAFSRAATFTPSPKMSCSSTITSPRLIPMRNLIRCSGGTSGLRSIIPRWTSTAQRTASTTLGKFRQQAVAGVLDDPAPVLLDLRIDQLPEMRLEPFVRPLLIRAHQARVPRHVGGEDRGEAADRRHLWPGGR